MVENSKVLNCGPLKKVGLVLRGFVAAPGWAPAFLVEPHFFENQKARAASGDMRPRPGFLAAPEENMEIESAWWCLCVNALQAKLQHKHFYRVMLNIGLFLYLTVARKCLPMLFCIDVEGVLYSLPDPANLCTATHVRLAQIVAAVTMVGFIGGFPIAILFNTTGLHWERASCIFFLSSLPVLVSLYLQFDAIPVTVAFGALCFVILIVWVTTLRGYVRSKQVKRRQLQAESKEELTQGAKKPRFVTYCRLSFIFKDQHRGWLAIVLLRNLLINFAYFVGTQVEPIDQFVVLGARFDYRILPFLMICVIIVIQTNNQPYLLDEDNHLETTTLVALLVCIYSDIATEAGKQTVQSDTCQGRLCKIQLNALVVIATVSLVVVNWIGKVMLNDQKKNQASLTKAGIMGSNRNFQTMSREDSSTDNLQTRTDVNALSTSLGDLSAAFTYEADTGGGGPGTVAASDSECTCRKTGSQKCLSYKHGSLNCDVSILAIRHKLVIADIIAWKKAFQIIDVDRGGTLDQKEIWTMWKGIDPSIRKPEVMEMFGLRVQDDDDATVNFEHFLAVMKHHRDNANEAEELEQLFSIISNVSASTRAHTHSDEDEPFIAPTSVGAGDVRALLERHDHRFVQLSEEQQTDQLLRMLQVRKTPSWPRSWANFSLLPLYSHRNAWANLHSVDQPNTFVAVAHATGWSGTGGRGECVGHEGAEE
jgi:hypothetical protein